MTKGYRLFTCETTTEEIKTRSSTQQSQWQDLLRDYSEGFIADDGGMLLFWPMLTELFKRCELLEQPEGEKLWQFIDDQTRYSVKRVANLWSWGMLLFLFVRDCF